MTFKKKILSKGHFYRKLSCSSYFRKPAHNDPCVMLLLSCAEPAEVTHWLTLRFSTVIMCLYKL